MGISLLDKQFRDYAKRLNVLKQNTLKCVAMNNAYFKRLQGLEVLPIPEDEYDLRDVYNNALSITLESIKMSEMHLEITKNRDKYSLIANEDEFIKDYNYILDHTDRFCMIANDIMKDGFVLDEQLDDIEQHLYLINKIACIQIKELDVAIKKWH